MNYAEERYTSGSLFYILFAFHVVECVFVCAYFSFLYTSRERATLYIYIYIYMYTSSDNTTARGVAARLEQIAVF